MAAWLRKRNNDRVANQSKIFCSHLNVAFYHPIPVYVDLLWNDDRVPPVCGPGPSPFPGRVGEEGEQERVGVRGVQARVQGGGRVHDVADEVQVLLLYNYQSAKINKHLIL